MCVVWSLRSLLTVFGRNNSISIQDPFSEANDPSLPKRTSIPPSGPYQPDPMMRMQFEANKDPFAGMRKGKSIPSPERSSLSNPLSNPSHPSQVPSLLLSPLKYLPPTPPCPLSFLPSLSPFCFFFLLSPKMFSRSGNENHW